MPPVYSLVVFDILEGIKKQRPNAERLEQVINGVKYNITEKDVREKVKQLGEDLIVLIEDDFVSVPELESLLSYLPLPQKPALGRYIILMGKTGYQQYIHFGVDEDGVDEYNIILSGFRGEVSELVSELRKNMDFIKVNTGSGMVIAQDYLVDEVRKEIEKN